MLDSNKGKKHEITVCGHLILSEILFQELYVKAGGGGGVIVWDQSAS